MKKTIRVEKKSIKKIKAATNNAITPERLEEIAKNAESEARKEKRRFIRSFTEWE